MTQSRHTARFWLDVFAFTILVAVFDTCGFILAALRRTPSLDSVNIAIDATPTFIATFFKHMVYKRNNKGKAIRELSYAEGLALVKEFLQFAATHTIEELQSFTGKETPTPSWADKKIVEIPADILDASAQLLRTHLEKDDPGLKDVGGHKWWTLRARPLFGEWIEMRRDATKREASAKAGRQHPTRVILYLHGGAHYFAGNGTHRYQIQRHARKLAAKAFSVSFRLAPQYPFPCSLHDALAAYLYLIAPPPDSGALPVQPHNLMLYGDSSGAGLALALQILLRDAGLPMPAGSVLISPWVDLTHSFPSVLGSGEGDYIPRHGFHYRPSLAWPPLRGDPMVFRRGQKQLVVKEQIQLYCANAMVAHPMVTLVNQGSLGGLAPMLVIGGSEELLADEIIYLAHKAANPAKYPPADDTLDRYPNQRDKTDKYAPTKVHLQMYDSCCHVTTTLSFSKPAKSQYRAAASFSLWALQAAQARIEREGKAELEKLDKDQSHRDYAMNDGKEEAAMPPGQDASPPRWRNWPSPNIQMNEPESRTRRFSESGRSPPISPIRFRSDTNGANGHPTRPRTHSLMESIHSMQSDEASVVTDEDASVANDENESMSDYEEGSESSSDGDVFVNGNVPPKNHDNDATKLAETGDLSEEDEKVVSGASKLVFPAKGQQTYVRVTGQEPFFKNNMVRQRVSPDGSIRQMELEDELVALTMSKQEVGRISPEGPIKKWLEKRREWDKRYLRDLLYWRKIKMKDRRKAAKAGYLSRDMMDENPPLSAVAGMWDEELAWRAVKGQDSSTSLDGQTESAGLGVMLWSKLSAKPDAQQEGKKTLDELARKGEKKLVRRPSSVKSLDIEEDISFEQ